MLGVNGKAWLDTQDRQSSLGLQIALCRCAMHEPCLTVGQRPQIGPDDSVQLRDKVEELMIEMGSMPLQFRGSRCASAKTGHPCPLYPDTDYPRLYIRVIMLERHDTLHRSNMLCQKVRQELMTCCCCLRSGRWRPQHDVRPNPATTLTLQQWPMLLLVLVLDSLAHPPPRIFD